MSTKKTPFSGLGRSREYQLKKTDDTSPQLKRLLSPSIALAPDYASLIQTLFPQLITHKEWLPQPQEPSEFRMQITKGLRRNRRNRA